MAALIADQLGVAPHSVFVAKKEQQRADCLSVRVYFSGEQSKIHSTTSYICI